MKDFIERIRSLPTFKRLREKSMIELPYSVEIDISRSDDDFVFRVYEMAAFCANNLIGEVRRQLPRTEHHAVYSFSEQADAAKFKLFFK